jgi:phosphatidate cytidylyltransferase
VHLKRWITGIFLLPLLVLTISYGGEALFVFVVASITCLALHEYFRISLLLSGRFPGALSFFGYASGLLILWSSFRASLSCLVLALAFHLLAVAAFAVFRFRYDRRIWEPVALGMLGVLYIPVLLASLVLLRNGASGVITVYFLLAVIFSGDTAAMYAGLFLGKHKLIPEVSPGKTIEGSIGGLLGSLIAGALFKLWFLPEVSWGGCILFSLASGLAGQVGDLFESVLKRSAGIKDSGRILPGHGGILDRIDALLFAAPVALAIRTYAL